MENIVIFQITTPVDDLYMALREDYKLEIGYHFFGTEAQNVSST